MVVLGGGEREDERVRVRVRDDWEGCGAVRRMECGRFVGVHSPCGGTHEARWPGPEGSKHSCARYPQSHQRCFSISPPQNLKNLDNLKTLISAGVRGAGGPRACARPGRPSGTERGGSGRGSSGGVPARVPRPYPRPDRRYKPYCCRDPGEGPGGGDRCWCCCCWCCCWCGGPAGRSGQCQVRVFELGERGRRRALKP